MVMKDDIIELEERHLRSYFKRVSRELIYASKTDKDMWERIDVPNYACIKEQRMGSREKRFKT